MMLPPVELLSGAGIGVVLSFTAWKLGLQPRLERRRAARGASA